MSVERERIAQSEEERADVFFQKVQSAFRCAAEQAGVVQRFYYIAGYTVCVTVAGTALVSHVISALAHLAAPPDSKIDFSICLWDTASTGVPSPPFPGGTHLGMRGEVQGYNTSRINTVCRHRCLSILDVSRDLGVFWAPSINEIPHWEHGAPLLTILHLWMRQRSRQVVHAAAVGIAEGGVLLAGKGGSGKSTTAIACLSKDMLYAGDDYVIVSETGPSVYGIYNTAKLAKGRSFFANLAPEITNPSHLCPDKALIFINGCYAAQLSRGFNLHAILLPRVTGVSGTRVSRTSPGSALIAMATSTIAQLPRAGECDFQRIATIVKQLPCYTLECGTDLESIPAVVEKCCRENRI